MNAESNQRDTSLLISHVIPDTNDGFWANVWNGVKAYFNNSASRTFGFDGATYIGSATPLGIGYKFYQPVAKVDFLFLTPLAFPGRSRLNE